MGREYVDRYQKFKSDDDYKPVPGIRIPKKVSDLRIPYELGKTRFDNLSQTHYGTPYCGWLIMLANPEYGGLEFKIPDNAIIRIPFPFTKSIHDYLSGIEMHIKLYGK